MSNKRKKLWDRKKHNNHRGTSKQPKGMIPQVGIINAPQGEEVQVLKEVPAMHTGLPGGDHAGEKVQVGIAILHDDGSVGLRYDEDAPIWALAEIQAYADKIGYSLAEGGFSNGFA